MRALPSRNGPEPQRQHSNVGGRERKCSDPHVPRREGGAQVTFLMEEWFGSIGGGLDINADIDPLVFALLREESDADAEIEWIETGRQLTALVQL